MGKGDIKTKRGKIHRGTTGVTRKAKKSKSLTAAQIEEAKKASAGIEKAPKKAAEKVKKPAAKKADSPELFSEETA